MSLISCLLEREVPYLCVSAWPALYYKASLERREQSVFNPGKRLCRSRPIKAALRMQLVLFFFTLGQNFR